MRKGFTLIELMIVLSIIGILAAIALPSYQVYVAKSKVISLVSTAAAGLPAFSNFYSDNGQVPGSVGAVVVGIDISSETKGFWNALNHTNFHSNIAYDHTDTQAKFTVTLAGVNGNVNTKKLDFIFEDIDGNMKFVCKRHPGLKRQYGPNLCHGFTEGGGAGGG
jgi:prepilin-type N-terminal cleavage/methylation domain-containing protein